jgi:glycosyltransferase involved in cell wall biosynthesis
MRALHYIASFFPNDTGASHSALRLAKGLRSMGVEVDFLVEDLGPEWRAGGQYEGFNVRSVPLTNPGKLRKIRGFLKLAKELSRLRDTYNVVHVHGAPYMNLLLAWLAGKWLRCPALVKITSDGWDTPDGVRSARHGLLALWIYRRIDGVVAMTSGQAGKCLHWNIHGIVKVIPNGVDLNVFRPATTSEKKTLREQLGIPADHKYLVYAGWLGYGKGTDVLFMVWQQLRSVFKNLDLLVVGNYMHDENMAGPLSNFLSQHKLPPEWAQAPGLHLIGKVPNVSDYLRAADVFIFPSRREGFGTVQIEAMACGLPCLVNDLPGVSSDIFPDDSHGIRIPGNNVDGFVKACIDILNNPSRRESMSHYARTAAVEKFSIHRIADQYIELYQQLAARA